MKLFDALFLTPPLSLSLCPAPSPSVHPAVPVYLGEGTRDVIRDVSFALLARSVSWEIYEARVDRYPRFISRSLTLITRGGETLSRGYLFCRPRPQEIRSVKLKTEKHAGYSRVEFIGFYRVTEAVTAVTAL